MVFPQISYTPPSARPAAAAACFTPHTCCTPPAAAVVPLLPAFPPAAFSGDSAAALCFPDCPDKLLTSCCTPSTAPGCSIPWKRCTAASSRSACFDSRVTSSLAPSRRAVTCSSPRQQPAAAGGNAVCVETQRWLAAGVQLCMSDRPLLCCCSLVRRLLEGSGAVGL